MAVLSTSTGHAKTLRAGLGARLLAALLLVVTGLPLAAQPVVSKESAVRAVFLFNFAQFVDWPPQAFATPQSPLIIGVLGEDPFGGYLDETVRGEQVNHRPLVIQRFHRVEEITACHVLFISRSETERLGSVFTALKGRALLTVGDTDAFSRNGGMIRFLTDRGKTRLRINLEAAKAAELTISSKLLRSAEIIPAGKE